MVLLAAILRLALLAWRPAHFDEGINGWFADGMAGRGCFAYDPTNYHGPLHFYVLFCAQTLLGHSLWVLRLPVALAGVAAVWVALRMAPFLGRTASRMAALFVAVSPAMVYYSRYSIHETWLVLFLLMFYLGIFDLWKRGSRTGLWACACGVCGMLLTKETWILHLAAAGAAWPCLLLWERFSASTPDPVPDMAPHWTWRDLMAAVAVNLAAFVFFYSGNFENWRGIVDAFGAFAPWYETGLDGEAVGAGHHKPFYFWLKLFCRTEWSALAGLAGCAWALWPAPRLVRYVAISGGGALLAYSLIAYKTPWCIAPILVPLLLVAGWAAARILETRWRRAGIAAVGLLTAGGVFESVRISIFACTDPDEPYVYVQTYHDIGRFTGPLLEAARHDARVLHRRGVFQVESYYPLPWMLADFTNIGYYGADNPPTDYEADFLLVDADLAPEVEPRLRGSYHVMDFTLRSGQKPSRAYFNHRVFKKYFADKPREFGHDEEVKIQTQ